MRHYREVICILAVKGDDERIDVFPSRGHFVDEVEKHPLDQGRRLGTRHNL